jgi:uncharacterized repeat protein (TIGR01451 family)
MKLSAQRFVSVTALLCIYTLVALQNFSLLTLAQEPAPFEISLTPQADQAISGQPFTYTVTITNVSRSPLKDIIVFMETPTGTTFANTRQNVNWFVTNPLPGEVGKIGWTTLEPMLPGEVVNLELSVNVLMETPDQQLINKEYGIVPMGGGDIIAFGPPIKTQLLLPTPTATSAPSPTTVATDTSILITATVQATLVAPTDSKPANTHIPATPVSQIGPTVVNTVQPISPTNVPLETSSPSASGFAIIAISFLIIVFIGLVWFLRRR